MNPQSRLDNQLHSLMSGGNRKKLNSIMDRTKPDILLPRQSKLSNPEGQYSKQQSVVSNDLGWMNAMMTKPKQRAYTFDDLLKMIVRISSNDQTTNYMIDIVDQLFTDEMMGYMVTTLQSTESVVQQQLINWLIAKLPSVDKSIVNTSNLLTEFLAMNKRQILNPTTVDSLTNNTLNGRFHDQPTKKIETFGITTIINRRAAIDPHRSNRGAITKEFDTYLYEMDAPDIRRHNAPRYLVSRNMINRKWIS